jgi:hypothetical protein
MNAFFASLLSLISMLIFALAYAAGNGPWWALATVGAAWTGALAAVACLTVYYHLKDRRRYG